MKIFKKILRMLLWIIALPLIVLVFVIALLLAIVLCLGRIRYRVDTHIGSDTTAFIEIKYLMRLVHCVITYKDGKFDNRIRVAWMRLGKEKPPKVVKPRKAKKSRKDDKSKTLKSPPLPEPEKEKKDRLKPLKQAKAVLTYPDLKTIIGLCFQCLQKFAKALKPKRLNISGIIGFDDPAATGWFMGAYEAAAGMINLRQKIRLIGSYHEKALLLDIEAKGRTRVFSLLWPFIWLYLKKPIRVVLHKHILRKDD